MFPGASNIGRHKYWQGPNKGNQTKGKYHHNQNQNGYKLWLGASKENVKKKQRNVFMSQHLQKSGPTTSKNNVDPITPKQLKTKKPQNTHGNKTRNQ